MSTFIPLAELLEAWPTDLVKGPDGLHAVGLGDYQVFVNTGGTFGLDGTIVLDEPIVFDLAFVPGLSLGFLYEDGHSELAFRFLFTKGMFYLSLTEVSATLRVDSRLITAVERRDPVGGGPPTFVPKLDPVTGDPEPVAIEFEGVALSIDSSGEVDVAYADGGAAPSFSMNAFALGGSGVVIDIEDFDLVLSNAAASRHGLPPGGDGSARGVLIERGAVFLPEGLGVMLPDTVELEDLFLGSGGVSGRISGGWTVAVLPQGDGFALSGDAAGRLFGFEFAIERMALEFKQNAIVTADIHGVLLVPFFDTPVAVDVAIDGLGDLAITLSPEQPAGEPGAPSSDSDGQLVLEKDGLLRFTLHDLALEKADDEVRLTLTGTIQPLFRQDEIEWPAIEVRALTLSSTGGVTLDADWVDLTSVESLDFFGFSIELERLGLGIGQDARWIGFSGGIALIDGLGFGGSVDGLKVVWTDTGDVTLELSGVGVGFTIPDTLSFTGAVAFIDDGVEKGFEGRARLTLETINLVVDAQVLITRVGGEPSLLVFLGAEFPAGVPLFQTGQAVFGLAGLFGYNRLPDKQDTEQWYGSSDPPEPGWYLRDAPGITVMDKWRFAEGGYAFGAGVTLGTLPDGYPFSAKTLLAVLLPGPIVLIEGKAQLLRDRLALSGMDPPFRALAVLDLAANYFQFNLDVKYLKPEAGEAPGSLIDIRGSAEVFFDLSDFAGSHLYLGQPPPEERIRAEVLALFGANAYLTLDASGVALGAWIGYASAWDFKVVKLALEAWMDAHASLSWKPTQLEAVTALYGAVELRACGILLGMSVGAGVELQTPRPFMVSADLRVEVNLPAPLPSAAVDVELRWEKPLTPPVPLPLQNVAVEHLKVSEKWVLDVWPHLASEDAPGFYDENAPPGVEPAPDAWPCVPTDGRLVLNFARPMHDQAPVGDNATTMPPAEVVGRYEYTYELRDVRLERRPSDDATAGWLPVPNPSDPEDASVVFGSWQLNGAGDPSNTSLMLWSNTPFDFAREAIDAPGWNQAVIASLDRFPAGYDVEAATVCVDFEGIEPGTDMPRVFSRDGVVFVAGHGHTVVARRARATRTGRALRLDAGPELPATMRMYMPEPAAEVRIDASIARDTKLVVRAFNKGTVIDEIEVSGAGRARTVTVGARPDRALEWVELAGADCLLLRICYVTEIEQTRAETQARRIERLANDTPAHWQRPFELLGPATQYRVSVDTRVVRRYPDGSEEDWRFEQFAHFETGQPPGCVAAPGTAGDAAGSAPGRLQVDRYPHGALGDLGEYVARTVPGHGAAFHYRGYDIQVDFDESYVRRMYAAAGRDLSLELHDSDGEPIRTPDGVARALTVRWAANQITGPGLAMAQYAGLLTGSGAADVTVDLLPPDDTIFGVMPEVAPMRPGTRHVLRLAAGGHTVYSVSFRTSRFASFADHAHSFRGVVWDHHRVTGEPDAPLVSPASLEAMGALVAAVAHRDLGGQVFAQLGDLLGLGFRTLPDDVELTHLRDGARSYGLLFESPEPLEWRRIELQLTRVAGEPGATGSSAPPPMPTEIDIVVVADADGTRALLLRPGDDAALVGVDAGTYALRLVFRRDVGPDAPVLRQGGSSDPEEATLTLGLR